MSSLSKEQTAKQQSRTLVPVARPPWAAAWEWLVRPVHFRAVRLFRLAAESGDVSRLAALLDPAVAVVVDSGAKARQEVRVVGGISDAIALLVHGMKARPGLAVVERSVNGQAGLMLTNDEEVTAAITVDFAGRLISVVWIRLHPEPLRHWNAV